MHEVAGNRTVVGDVLLGRGARSVKEALQCRRRRGRLL
jgi:hypothetical protein